MAAGDAGAFEPLCDAPACSDDLEVDYDYKEVYEPRDETRDARHYSPRPVRPDEDAGSFVTGRLGALNAKARPLNSEYREKLEDAFKEYAADAELTDYERDIALDALSRLVKCMLSSSRKRMPPSRNLAVAAVYYALCATRGGYSASLWLRKHMGANARSRMRWMLRKCGFALKCVNKHEHVYDAIMKLRDAGVPADGVRLALRLYREMRDMLGRESRVAAVCAAATVAMIYGLAPHYIALLGYSRGASAASICHIVGIDIDVEVELVTRSNPLLDRA